MKFDVRKDIDAFERKYADVLQALADAWIGEKYRVVIARDGVSHINKRDRTIHVDPTGRLLYLYAMGAYAGLRPSAEMRLFDPNDVGEVMFFYAKTALLHEALHALHTDGSAVCEYMKKFTSLTDVRVFHSVFNCVEDGYIEYNFADDVYEDGTTLLLHVREIENDAILKPRYALTCAKSNIKLNDTSPFPAACFDGYDEETGMKLKAVLRKLNDYLNAVLIMSTEDAWDIDHTLDEFGIGSLDGLNELHAILPINDDEADTVQRLDACLRVYETIKKNVDGFELLYGFFDETNVGYGLCADEARGFYTYDGWKSVYENFVDCGGKDSLIRIVESDDGVNVVAHRVEDTADSTTVYLERVRLDENGNAAKIDHDDGKYEDTRSYGSKRRDGGIEISLQYKRNFSEWTHSANDLGLPELNGYQVHSVKNDYTKKQEQAFDGACVRNHAVVKAVETSLGALLIRSKRFFIRKQSMGTKLDTHNLIDRKRRVFVKPTSGVCDDFDISVLIDLSGSVTRAAYSSLCEKTIIFAKACVNVGVPIRVQSFCNVNGRDYIYTETHKGFDESIKALSSLFNYSHGGFNSFDLLAISNIRRSLASSSNTRHIVLYVTDGQGLFVSKDGTEYTARSCRKEIVRLCAAMAHGRIGFIPVCFDSAAATRMPDVFRNAVCCNNGMELKTRLVPRIGEELWKI